MLMVGRARARGKPVKAARDWGCRMQKLSYNNNRLYSYGAAHIGAALAGHIALGNAIAALGLMVVQGHSRQWLTAIEAVHDSARASGFATVALLARALESELADGGRMRAIACYMEAMEDALDLDAAHQAGARNFDLARGQEALLASLALRMHG